MTKRGRGRLKGGIGYPGKKTATAHNLMETVEKALRDEEGRMGVSKSAIVNFLVRDRPYISRQMIERDIEKATREETDRKNEARRKRVTRLIS